MERQRSNPRSLRLTDQTPTTRLWGQLGYCAKAYRLLRAILNTAVDDGLIRNPLQQHIDGIDDPFAELQGQNPCRSAGECWGVVVRELAGIARRDAGDLSDRRGDGEVPWARGACETEPE